MKTYRRHAFTLIELLVVIAIIALLVSILVPSLSSARELARKTICGTNMRSMGIGVGMYAQDNQEAIPFFFARRSMTKWDMVWWCDVIVPYFDADAKPSKFGCTAVGVQPADGQYNIGNGIVLSQRMSCASQKRTGSLHFSWNANYVNSPRCWIGNFTGKTQAEAANLGDGYPVWSDGVPIPLSKFGQLSQYCTIMETDPWSWWYYNPAAYSDQMTDLSKAAPHLKTMNLLMLDGHVGGTSAADMLQYSKDAKYGYPWNAP